MVPGPHPGFHSGEGDTGVPVGIRNCVLAGNFENISYAEAKLPYMDSEILKAKVRTLAPE